MFAPETISIVDFRNYDLILISPTFSRLVAVRNSSAYGYDWINEEETYKFYGCIVYRHENIVRFLEGKEVEVYT